MTKFAPALAFCPLSDDADTLMLYDVPAAGSESGAT